MGNRSKRTEHTGAKQGRGAYYGRKRDAKQDSAKRRRANDAAAAHEVDTRREPE